MAGVPKPWRRPRPQPLWSLREAWKRRASPPPNLSKPTASHLRFDKENETKQKKQTETQKILVSRMIKPA